MFQEKSIFIIDDSRVVVQSVQKILSEYGCDNITTASGAEEAVDIMKEKSFDLVLLDYQMPGKNGEYVLDFIRSRHPGSAVIMLSGQQEKDIVVRLMRKADNYIIKDNILHVREELISAITHIFEIRRLRDENRKLLDKLKERNEKLEQQLRTARLLLKEVFPKKLEKSSAFNISIFNRGWDVIGGDYYNVSRLDGNRIGVFIGDICGHGIEAAMLLFTLSNAYKDTVKESASSKETLEKLNSLLLRQFPQGSFVTCAFLVIDDRTRTISLTSAMDTPILYLREDKTITEIRHGELSCLGLVDMNHKAYKGKSFFEEKLITLTGHEKLIMFTDGVIEAKNEANELFRLNRTKAIIGDHYGRNIDETIQAISAAVMDFTKTKVKDDMTIIGIEKIV